jgi:solute carrier family 25 (mitochondrial carnitine/acylcarnitine transporter), member 20/29
MFLSMNLHGRVSKIGQLKHFVFYNIFVLINQVRMQTSSGGGGSVMGMLGKTVQVEGIRGLYRGVSAPLVAVTPLFALSFWGYDMGQRVVRAATPSIKATDDLSLTQKIIAGGLSALPSTIVTAPSERVKCLLQIQKQQAANVSIAGSTAILRPQYNGMVDCAAAVYREGGIRSLYRGTIATLLRDVPGSMAWFGAYEYVKRTMSVWQGVTDPSQLSTSAVIMAGGTAGLAMWIIAIPADVLKTRFQTAPEGTYRGIVDVYRHLIATEGYGALYTGIRPALIRAYPANAACFLGMELSRKGLDQIFG